MNTAVPLPLTLTTDKAGILTSWQQVDLDSDLFTPADLLHLVGPVTQEGVPVPWPLLKTVYRVSATLMTIPVFTGFRTQVNNSVDAQSDTITLEAMDAAKILIDCPPLKKFKRPAGSLQTFAAELCGALGIPVQTDAAAQIPVTDTTAASSTQPIYSILEPIANEMGCVIWCDAIGMLHIESMLKYYALPTVGLLVSAPAGPQAGGNNILSYELTDNAGERFSHICVRGSRAHRAKHGNFLSKTVTMIAVEGVAVDPELVALGIYRPKTIYDSNARSIAQAQRRAAREMRINRIDGTKITCTVEGFLSDSSRPWAPTQMVVVAIPEKGIGMPMFIAGRRFLRNETDGDVTQLTLIEPGRL